MKLNLKMLYSNKTKLITHEIIKESIVKYQGLVYTFWL